MKVATLSNPTKCESCSGCLMVCEQEAIKIEKREINGKIKKIPIFDPEKCNSCGKCVEKCDTGALELISKDSS